MKFVPRLGICGYLYHFGFWVIDKLGFLFEIYVWFGDLRLFSWFWESGSLLDLGFLFEIYIDLGIWGFLFDFVFWVVAKLGFFCLKLMWSLEFRILNQDLVIYVSGYLIETGGNEWGERKGGSNERCGGEWWCMCHLFGLYRASGNCSCKRLRACLLVCLPTFFFHVCFSMLDFSIVSFDWLFYHLCMLNMDIWSH